MNRWNNFAPNHPDLMYRLAFDVVLVILVAVTILVIEQSREDRRVAEAERVALQTALSLEESLEGRILAGLGLSDIRLPGRSLAGVDFTDTALDGVDFRGTDLRHSVFNGATLSDADLGPLGSDDPRTNQRGLARSATDLTGSTFHGADLRGADLSSAILYDVSFTGSTLDGAVLALACHDESTVWPSGFSAPLSGVECSRELEELAVIDEGRTYYPTAELSHGSGIYYSLLNDSGGVFVGTGEIRGNHCAWYGDFDVWKVLRIVGSHVLLHVETVEDAPQSITAYRLGGWTQRPDRTKDGCETLGIPGIDWDRSALFGQS